MKGNRTNHPPKYLTIEAFQKWMNNDFRHVQLRQARQEGILWVIVSLSAILLARALGVW